MKHSLTIAIAALLLTGCATTGDKPDPEKMSALVEMATYTGTGLYLLEHPDDGPKFRSVRNTLQNHLDLGEISASTFVLTMQMLPIKELKGNESAIIIGNALILWDIYQGQTITLDDTVYIKPLMEGAIRGLNRGMQVIGGSGSIN